MTIDGHVVKGDERRAAGIHANAALRVDPVIKNTTLSDLTGGSAVLYTYVGGSPGGRKEAKLLPRDVERFRSRRSGPRSAHCGAVGHVSRLESSQSSWVSPAS
ncbi:MAG: hypothetical protein FJZ38_22915 [Candidatus Rokubacteria bacterium]|nr:hypothetical protein [Candidatus Rokubacteria bacterium]